MTSRRSGQSFIVIVILIGAIVAAVGLTIALWTSTFLDSSSGYEYSTEALNAANSGAEDALLRLNRNPNFSGSYSFMVGGTFSINFNAYQTPAATALVTVTQDSPSTGFITIVVSSSANNYTGKVNVVVSKNTTTTQLTVISWQQTQ